MPRSLKRPACKRANARKRSRFDEDDEGSDEGIDEGNDDESDEEDDEEGEQESDHESEEEISSSSASAAPARRPTAASSKRIREGAREKQNSAKQISSNQLWNRLKNEYKYLSQCAYRDTHIYMTFSQELFSRCSWIGS